MNFQNPFIEAARAGKNDLWRYAATILLMLVLALISGVCLSLPAFLLGGGPDLTRLPENVFLVIGLAPSAILILGLWLGVRLLHRRPFSSLVRPPGQPLRWGLMALSAVVWLVISAAGDLALSRLHPGTYQLVFEPARFWIFALLTLLLMPIQVAFEELTFRGYLTQGTGLAGGFWAALVVPAVLFGLLHGLNPEVGFYGILTTMPQYIGIGLVLGWLTLRSSGLEMAFGLHLANNLYGTLLVTPPVSVLPSPGLVRIQQVDEVAVLVTFLVGTLVFVGIIWALGRRSFLRVSNP